MRVVYLLEETSISGDVRVAIAQADALIARGHEVIYLNGCAGDIAAAIGQTEQKRLSDSLREELPFTMSVVDLTVDLMGLMFRSESK